MTNTKRPPLTADETTGLKVAGFHVLHEDELHERDYHLAAATARADKAESRVRMAAESFVGLMALVDDDIKAAESGATAEDLLLRLGSLREQLLDEVDYYRNRALVDETDYGYGAEEVEQ